MLHALLLLAALQQAPAAAPVCPVTPGPLSAEWAGWTTTAPLTAAGRPADLATAALTPGHRADVALLPASGVTFATPLARPAPAGSTGGMLALTVTSAGKYRLSFGGAIWADVIGPDGKTIAPVGHGHGPDCSAIRKYVDFALQPGRYVVQLSEGKVTVIGAMLTPAP
ncbi:MAG: hypothetical protein JWL96_4009 [Sphingomonas bacterium]|uniref:homogentisate 1,2-dioxygenase n=1 Tax=Sphingomonas bacterium TaxID=1895847 RepID=UPI0026257E3A|nr:homogentisate 1,2-dioxygenase [Sphingomonas bacterium]MDB5711939.1 hypothetical protein [Sphingomonas bacterium]